jgi:large subunit ribosomal protein L15
MPSELNLSTLKPAQKRRDRKRVGRGLGSGKGRYSGRGIKGQKSRAGSHKMRAGFEGGQMPIYMRLGKMRGSTSKDAMPIGPFRTVSQGVNVSELERVFDAGTEVTPELLKAKRLIRSIRVDVKILGHGDLTKKLTVSAHGFSKTAREKIEAAGGTITWLRGEPVPKVKKQRKRAIRDADEPREQTAEATADADAEPEAEAGLEDATGPDGDAEPAEDAEA